MTRDARQTALEVLVRIERRKGRADEALDQALEKEGLSVRDRSLTTELVYGVLRHRNRLDWLIGQFCRKPVEGLSPTLRNILRVGAYQLIFLSRIPARAAVDEAVRLTQRKGAKGMSGFVNAVLRSLDRDRAIISYPEPSADLVEHYAVRFSHPRWLVSRWLQRFGPERTVSLCLNNNEVPPVTLRINTQFTTRERLSADLRAARVAYEECAVSPVGIRTRGEGAAKLDAFRKGHCYIQDEASQLVGLALQARPGEVVLDACAAPGGKTTHVAQIMGGQGKIIALDVQGPRLKLIRENCKRLGIKMVQCVLGDARQLGRWTRIQFDRILVDAPCSGLGVLRRNPEGKWYKTEDLIPRYARLQSEILDGVSSSLKTGGVLVYSTCSTEPEENEQVVDRFVKSHAEFRIQNLQDLLPPAASSMITPEGFLFTLFNKESMDIFFTARMIKEAT